MTKIHTSLCPRCLLPLGEHPALSRRDNESDICAPCGIDEALVDQKRATGELLTIVQHIKEERIFQLRPR